VPVEEERITSGLTRCSNCVLFDGIIGAGEKRRRYV